jgi:hypothetical protein
MTASLMPSGWDLDRIRDHSGDQAAEILDTDRVITVEGSAEPLKAAAAFGFRDLAIVRLAGDDEWHMGSLDQSTGAIHLWAASYDDFENALRGL